MLKSSIWEHGNHIGTWKQKANIITHTNIQHKKGGKFNSEREKSPLKDPWLVGICIRRHLGVRLLLLWHSHWSKPLTVSLGINCGSRSTSCWSNVARSIEVKAIVIVTVIGDALKHTAVSGEVVVVHSNLKHNEKHTTQKNIHYNNFLCLNTSRTG